MFILFNLDLVDNFIAKSYEVCESLVVSWVLRINYRLRERMLLLSKSCQRLVQDLVHKLRLIALKLPIVKSSCVPMLLYRYLLKYIWRIDQLKINLVRR